MDVTALFIDGGYLNRVLRDLGSPRVDYGRLSLELSRPYTLLRTFYSDCLPYISDVPTEDEEERLEKRCRFFDALRRLARFELHEGKLEHLGVALEGRRSIYEHKQVAVYLAANLVRLATKTRIRRAALIAGDGNYVPALRIAKDEGVAIHLYYGANQHPDRELWDVADDRTPVTANLVSPAIISPSTDDRRRGFR